MRLILAVTLFIALQAQAQQSNLTRKNVLSQMEKVADWQLQRWSDSGSRHAWWDWTNAAGYTGVLALSKLSSNPAYEKRLISIGDSLNWQTGPRRFHADDYCIGQMYALLYAKHKDPRMIAAFRLLADSIVADPHNESLEWKNNIARREWAWCDALFMGPTALSYLSTVTKEKKYLDISNKLWWKTTDYLYDSTEHLYFRDGSFLDKKEKNGEKVFWSRGNGWVIAGLVRVLDNMPKLYPDRKRYVNLYREMAARVAALQQADGSWHASLLDPASYPIKEMSGTGFFTYALMWGINNKVLDREKYWPVVQKGWTALTGSIHPNGMLGYIQPIGAAPGAVTENSTEIYGVGAFLLAGSEIHKSLRK